MRFLRKAAGAPRFLAVFSGAFHPPTKAHMALAHAAIDSRLAEEVLFVLPESFPHKGYAGLTLDRRLELLDLAIEGYPQFSVGISRGGLFLEIAEECRESYGPAVSLRFLCGRDAADRIVNWDYGPLPPIGEQLADYELLVAPRQGCYAPPPDFDRRVHALPVSPEVEQVSSTEVRERMAHGLPWEHLVPESIVEPLRTLVPELRAASSQQSPSRRK